MNDFLAFLFMVVVLSAIIYLVGLALGYTLNILLVIVVACLLTALANMTGG